LAAPALAAVGASLALSCAKPPPPAPSFSAARGFDPLEVCTTRSFNRYTRSVTCRDTELLFVSRADAPETLRENKRASLAAYGIPVEDRSLLLGGKDAPALGYHMGPFESPSVSVLFLALAVGGSQESIDAQCYRLGQPVDPKRCSTLLDAFVNQGLTRGEWPSTLAARDPQVPVTFDLVGREVRLPSNCDDVAPLELECRDGRLKLLVAESADQLPRILQTDLAASEGTLLRAWTAPCSVDGVSTTCSLRKQHVGFEDVTSVRAAVVLRDKPVMLACEAKRSRAAQPPGPICAQLFQVAPEAFAEPEPTE
jgi:hypothetical protein